MDVALVVRRTVDSVESKARQEFDSAATTEDGENPHEREGGVGPCVRANDK